GFQTVVTGRFEGLDIQEGEARPIADTERALDDDDVADGVGVQLADDGVQVVAGGVEVAAVGLGEHLAGVVTAEARSGDDRPPPPPPPRGFSETRKRPVPSVGVGVVGVVGVGVTGGWAGSTCCTCLMAGSGLEAGACSGAWAYRR